MNDLEKTFSLILEQTDGGTRCPAHDDALRSLSLKYTKDKILLKCHAGCDYKEVLEAIDLKPSELFADTKENSGRRQNHSPQIENSAKEKRIKASFNNEGKVEMFSYKYAQKITETNLYRYEDAEGEDSLSYH